MSSSDLPVRLALDPGAVRVGVARSAGNLAFPVGVVQRGDADIAEIAALAVANNAAEVVIG
ncbi:MAG: Holliday junction resolvase RuvX, partial [Actinobacteria bacterium]|nr:Holliday junction resolvase RuvX [Actinomycetota bacterium]